VSWTMVMLRESGCVIFIPVMTPRRMIVRGGTRGN
jgi:hypothetical protein